MDVSLAFLWLQLLFSLWLKHGTCDIIYPDEEELEEVPTAPDATLSYLDLAKDVLTEIDNINQKLKDVFGKGTKDAKGEKGAEQKAVEDEEIVVTKSMSQSYKDYDIKACECECQCAESIPSVQNKAPSSLRYTLQAAGKMIKNKIHGITL